MAYSCEYCCRFIANKDIQSMKDIVFLREENVDVGNGGMSHIWIRYYAHKKCKEKRDNQRYIAEK